MGELIHVLTRTADWNRVHAQNPASQGCERSDDGSSTPHQAWLRRIKPGRTKTLGGIRMRDMKHTSMAAEGSDRTTSRRKSIFNLGQMLVILENSRGAIVVTFRTLIEDAGLAIVFVHRLRAAAHARRPDLLSQRHSGLIPRRIGFAGSNWAKAADSA